MNGIMITCVLLCGMIASIQGVTTYVTFSVNMTDVTYYTGMDDQGGWRDSVIQSVCNRIQLWFEGDTEKKADGFCKILDLSGTSGEAPLTAKVQLAFNAGIEACTGEISKPATVNTKSKEAISKTNEVATADIKCSPAVDSGSRGSHVRSYHIIQISVVLLAMVAWY